MSDNNDIRKADRKRLAALFDFAASDSETEAADPEGTASTGANADAAAGVGGADAPDDAAGGDGESVEPGNPG